MMNKEIKIREYRASDRDMVRKISYDTSFLEQPRLFLSERGLLADLLTMYYTDYEPESCFVAAGESGVVGYLAGAKNSQKMENILYYRILPSLILKAFGKGLFFQPSFLKLFCHVTMSFLKGEFRNPDYSREYPALLHINLDKNFRNCGIGRALLEYFEQHLRDRRIKGVYLGTMSEQAKEFFIKNSYQLLYQAKRSYFRYRVGKDIPFYILAKKL
jgi:GNAT superfamily N-acetyltransferase